MAIFPVELDLRVDLGAPGTAAGIGSTGPSNVQADLNARLRSATRAELAAILAPSGFAFLTDAGREGIFKWVAGNKTAFVNIDAQQGIHIAPASAPTGVSGAWVRQYSGPIDIRWFGAVLDGTTSCDTAFQAWMTYMVRYAIITFGDTTGGKPRGYVPHGRVKITQGFTPPASGNGWGFSIEGDGPSSSSIELHSDTATLFDFT